MKVEDVTVWFEGLIGHLPPITEFLGHDQFGRAGVEFDEAPTLQWLTEARSALEAVLPPAHPVLQQWDSLVTAPVSENYLQIVAATVIAGGALESHLRHLCTRASVTPKAHSISGYEQALATERKAGREIISANDGKNVTSWGGWRNDAAHTPATFTRSKAEVRVLVEGIRQFVSRYP